MRRRTLSLSIALVVPMMLLVACGGSDDKKSLPPLAPTSAAPTSSSTPTTFPTTRPEAKNLHVVTLGRNAAKTAEEKTVVTTWVRYWQALSDTYYHVKPAADLDLATGKALSGPLDYLAELKTKHQHVGGWARNNVLSIAVKGNRAALRDCVKNFTFNVNASGKPVEEPPPYLNATGTLKKKNGHWLVTSASVVDSSTSCLK
jgi:hypothetical protein